jgi:hypothetical protein
MPTRRRAVRNSGFDCRFDPEIDAKSALGIRPKRVV